jgi:ribosomal protein S18 acetylase RimI-like enzyme
VGVIWYGLRGKQEAFVWDILVYPPYRQQGYGKEALVAMELDLRQMQILQVHLNVFPHNLTAARLYSTLGYRAVATRMAKALA